MATRYAQGTTPIPIAEDEHLTTRIWERMGSAPSQEALRHHAGGAWQPMTWRDLGERVRGVAAGLVALGLQPGERVALMASTSLEWTLVDLAVLAAGGVVVPIYETSSAGQCAWILASSGATLAVAETPDQAKALEAGSSEAGTGVEVFVLADGGLDDISERAGDEDLARVLDRTRAIAADDLATLIYTSGTTGNPKGCELTHRNLLNAARQGSLSLRPLLSGEDDSTLLFLPLAHVFARMVQFMCLEADVPLILSRGMDRLQEDLAETRPTFLLSVPRVFEKVFNGAQRKAQGPRAKVFDFAVTTSRAWSEAVSTGRRPGLATTLKKGLADRLVYAKLRDALGGRVGYCISGGAPLAPHLAHFFHAAGITILEGYGLTETSAPATVNTPDALRIGTVGRPLPGMEVRVADDGELHVRGDSVFRGYHGNPEATDEVLDPDGWFATGDLGEVDADGFVRVTGRKKEIIVTASGKNVAPAVLEERLKANRLISQAMVVGDDRPFVGALLTLDPDELAAFADEHGLSGEVADLASSEPVQQEVGRAVEHANEAVSRAESIRRWTVLERDFSEDAEELTPTLKVRRRDVAEHFADEIDRLYAR